MADATTVNPQITDDVAQSNLQAIADSPATAVSTIYQALGHSTGILFENAVAAQQQQNAIAQAAANQGVMQIYSLDTTAAGGAALSAFDATPEAVNARTAQSAARIGAGSDAHTGAANEQIEAAVRLSNEIALGRAADVAYAVRACADTLASALQTVSQALHADRMRMLKAAATTACLQGMLRDPSKTAEYEAVLASIERLR